MLPERKRMIDAGFFVKSSYTGDFLLHVLDCLKQGKHSFEKDTAEKLCSKLREGFTEAVWLEDARGKNRITELFKEDAAIAGWAEKENLAYAPVWKARMAEAEECRQDFDDFLNWRFHQIEFFFKGSDVKGHVIRLAELSQGQKPPEAENIQFIPLVTCKDMYAIVYFGLLEQLVRPLAVSVMIHKGYEQKQETVKRLSRLAVCILVDACHTVLRQDLLREYKISDWDLNHAAELFDLPEELCSCLGDCLLGME